VTAPRPGDAFHLDLDNAAATPAFIEFTFIPTGDDTEVEIQLSGLNADDAEFYPQLLERYLDRIKAAFPGK
jgi:hypothetical protein